MPVVTAGTPVTIDLAGQATDKLQYTSATGFSDFLQVIFTAIITIGAIAVFFFFILGGLEWILAGGEKSKIESARNKIMGAIMGFVVLASSLAVFGLIQTVFHLNILSF